MWKKLGWVFVGIYAAAILYLNIVAILEYNGFSCGAILSLVLTLLPAGVIALELAIQKMPKAVSILLALPTLLIAAVFFLGSIKFNSMGIETLAKAVLFGISMILIVFLAFKRLSKK